MAKDAQLQIVREIIGEIVNQFRRGDGFSFRFLVVSAEEGEAHRLNHRLENVWLKHRFPRANYRRSYGKFVARQGNDKVTIHFVGLDQDKTLAKVLRHQRKSRGSRIIHPGDYNEMFVDFTVMAERINTLAGIDPPE